MKGPFPNCWEGETILIRKAISFHMSMCDLVGEIERKPSSSRNESKNEDVLRSSLRKSLKKTCARGGPIDFCIVFCMPLKKEQRN